MNQHIIQPLALPAEALPDNPRAKDHANSRSLALQLRRNGHEQRRWSRAALAKGHHEAATAMAKRADRYAADALWWWQRSRRT